MVIIPAYIMRWIFPCFPYSYRNIRLLAKQSSRFPNVNSPLLQLTLKTRRFSNLPPPPPYNTDRKQMRTVTVRYNQARIFVVERNLNSWSPRCSRLRLLPSIFQFNFTFKTKVMNDLKFKTRETATTTSPRSRQDVTKNILTFARRRELRTSVSI